MSQSLQRALHILSLLGDEPASLDDLAGELDVHKTTVLRLLRPLTEEHFTYRDEQHRYHLGARLLELAAAAADQRTLRVIASPHLTSFNREYGRTTHLAEREGSNVVYIEKLESRDQIRMFSRVGTAANLNSTGVAKVILADLPDDQLEREVDRIDFVRRTPNTITDPAVFLREVREVRERGWATDREENEPSINCIAMPVRGQSGRVLGAVSVSVPDVVLPYEDLLGLLDPLRATCTAISVDCGYRPAES